MRLAAALAGLLVSGCLMLPHKVERVTVNGEPVEVHTDHPAAPCPATAAGCYEFTTRRVFLRSPVRPDTREHELAHAAGMRHGPWLHYPAVRMICADVTVPGGSYSLGEVICIDAGGERTFSASILRN